MTTVRDVEEVYRQIREDFRKMNEDLERRLESQRKFDSFMGVVGLIALVVSIGLIVWMLFN